MPADIAQVLIVVLLLGAFVVAVRSFWAWRALGRLASLARARAQAVEGAPPRLLDRSDRWRAGLAQVNTPTERALWSLAVIDRAVDAAVTGLGERREALERVRRHHLPRVALTVRHVRSTVRLLRRLNGLRRTFQV